jgi:hypothetical protein
MEPYLCYSQSCFDILKRIESFFYALFPNIYKNLVFNQAFMSKTLCWVYHAWYFTFLCVSHTEEQIRGPPTAAVNLAPDWLGFDPEHSGQIFFYSSSNNLFIVFSYVQHLWLALTIHSRIRTF